jgi:hypothetical protein
MPTCIDCHAAAADENFWNGCICTDCLIVRAERESDAASERYEDEHPELRCPPRE